jgi:hypothetical protein
MIILGSRSTSTVSSSVLIVSGCMMKVSRSLASAMSISAVIGCTPRSAATAASVRQGGSGVS